MNKLVGLLVGLAVCGVLAPPLTRAAMSLRATNAQVRVHVDAIAWHQCNFTPGWHCSDHRYHVVRCYADVRNQTWHCWGSYLLYKRGAWNWVKGVLGFHVPHYVVNYLAIMQNYPLRVELWETGGYAAAADRGGG